MSLLPSKLSLPLVSSFGGAQALWWPCSAPEITLLFIPGNPGLASYYTPYLNSIYASPKLRGKVEILALSHRGHAPTSSQPITGTGLKDQIRHKVAAVDALSREGVKLVVGGHSIGAYMAVEVMKERKDKVHGLHLLFPTLSWIGRTPNGRRLTPLFHPLVSTFILPIPLFILSLIPVILLLPFVRLISHQPSVAARTTLDLLTTPSAVPSALRLAHEEMTTVKALTPSTKEAFSTFSGMIRTYWSRGDEDGWAPSWLRSQVEVELSLRPHGTRHLGTRSFSLSEYRSATTKRSIPNLRGATAKRKLTGDIVIETTVESSESGEEDSARILSGTRESASVNLPEKRLSTHCDIGMPHAFCLRHGEFMGEITAQWLANDHL